MSISQIALRRLVEERLDEDLELRERMERQHRPRLRDARLLQDEELLEKVGALGFTITRDWLDAATQTETAAFHIANKICDDCQVALENGGHDWVWFAIICLWERWFPDRANMEMLDDRIQDGYQAAKQQDAVGACVHWRSAWQLVIQLADACKIESIADFDQSFGGLQSVFNWVQDYESELWTASAKDNDFSRERIELCQLVTQRFRDCDDLMQQNFRRAIAESHFELGETEISDRLYSKWLEDDPAWGWGWIGWADCYRFAGDQRRDPQRSIQLLEQGLAVQDVRDRADLLDRLVQFHEEDEQFDAADERRRELEATNETRGQLATSSISGSGSTLRVTQSLDFSGSEVPLEEWQDRRPPFPNELPSMSGDNQPAKLRVGRNEPCPCGSGKKYKKCCGRS